MKLAGEDAILYRRSALYLYAYVRNHSFILIDQIYKGRSVEWMADDSAWRQISIPKVGGPERLAIYGYLKINGIH